MAAVIHKLKTWPDPFGAVWRGAKPYEIRKADRPFSVGDMLHLEEYVPTAMSSATRAEGYTGRTVIAEVTYLTRGGEWGLPTDLCVLGLRRRETIDMSLTVGAVTRGGG